MSINVLGGESSSVTLQFHPRRQYYTFTLSQFARCYLIPAMEDSVVGSCPPIAEVGGADRRIRVRKRKRE
jgi:hypothetical protein